MKRLLGLVVLTCVACAGIAPVRVTPLNDPGRVLVARDAASVQLFTDSRPSQSFAEVSALQDLNEDAWEARLARMRQRAADLGCDGLIVNKHDTGGTCIVFK